MRTKENNMSIDNMGIEKIEIKDPSKYSTDLDKYEAVNKCETLEDLARVIRSFSDERGRIQGRRREFDAEKMAGYCEGFTKDSLPNFLTREFGIRQQAMYIAYYEK